MALVVEDGSAKSDADSYSEVADAQTYYTAMGYSDTPAEATMRRGTRWLDAMYEVARKVSTDMKVDESKSIRSVKAGSVEVHFATAQEERETLDYVKWLVNAYLTPGNRVIRGA